MGEMNSLQGRRLLLFALLLLALASLPMTGHILMRWLLIPNILARLGGLIRDFVTIFLGIFIEAVPFLLAGTLVSGFLDVFVSREQLRRFIPGRGVKTVAAGVLLGLFFPVCECGVVPVTRRLFQKGVPLSAGITFLLAAPVMNPVVIASTWAAFGFGRILVGRVLLAGGIAGLVGLVFSLHPRPKEVMVKARSETFAHQDDCATPDRPTSQQVRDSGHACSVPDRPTPEQVRDSGHACSVPDRPTPEQVRDSGHACSVPDRPTPRTCSGLRSGLPGRFYHALLTAGEEFFEMGRYLVVGALLAAAVQTIVPQAAILRIGRGPVSSVLGMLTLAFVLSVCSTVDAFLALAFAGSFTTASLLAFLVFGPMVDLKSTLMFLGVFERRIVAYLILLPLQLVFLITVFANLNLSL
jgi:uncharacterized membrane protein YraQ (UPF0718 family)